MRIRLLFLLAGFPAILPAAATIVTKVLPANTYVNAAQVDSAGNLYLAGYSATGSAGTQHVFVAKFSPDASQTIWSVALAGSKNDRATGLALGPANTVYVTGSTQSTDFPVTKGAFATAGSAFAVKLDAAGAVLYSTFIPASSAQAVAVDAAGDAFVTGGVGPSDALTATPGSVAGAPVSQSSSYILELDPTGGRALVSVIGFGGSEIAVDAQGNIYAAGAPSVGNAPTTPGAFQPSVTVLTCEQTFGFGIVLCGYQHVVKIDPTGTRLIYATYLAGMWGANPSGMAVDSAGNVILAGSTSSPDYPTTPAAYQPLYMPNPAQQVGGHDVTAPPTTGFITKLNASGTGLVWSTFLGGSGVAAGSFTAGDQISSMAVDPSGNILLDGIDASTDFPGVYDTPVASRPVASNPGKAAAFVARLSPDGGLLGTVTLVPLIGALAERPDGGAAIASAAISLVTFAAPGRVNMITDPADNAKVVNVSPGQLLTLYGTNLAPQGVAPTVGGYPTGFQGVTVTFNGIAAPLLYTAGNQINLEVPYEIAGQTEVTMQVTSGSVTPPVSESYILAVVPRQPSLFLSAAAFAGPYFGVASCAGRSLSAYQALEFNADGSLNSCTNPAIAGSTVTVFLNGLGVTNPPQLTGAISGSPMAISPAVVSSASTLAWPTATVGGLIADVVAVQVPVPAGSAVITLSVGGVSPVRGPGFVIWVK